MVRRSPGATQHALDEVADAVAITGAIRLPDAAGRHLVEQSFCCLTVRCLTLSQEKGADIVNAKVTALEGAPTGYKTFKQGTAQVFVRDPRGALATAA